MLLEGFQVKRALKEDSAAIKKIVEDLDLSYKGFEVSDFFVGKLDGKIVAIARVQAFDDILFLTCVGVIEKYQGRGIAKAFLEKLTAIHKDKDIYLNTVIPEFFQKLGFHSLDLLDPSLSELVKTLPPKKLFNCEECFPERCRFMVKRGEK